MPSSDNSTSPVAQQLDRLIQLYMDTNRSHLPTLPFDSQWPSACWIAKEKPEDGTETPWQPVAMQQKTDMFDRLKEALGYPIHPATITYYSRYWSDPIRCRHPEGELELLFCWNEADLERLRGNLVGHLLILRKRRRPASLFFACTDGDDFMAIDNDDGSIWLERPGGKRMRQLAPDMETFLSTLEPLSIPQ